MRGWDSHSSDSLARAKVHRLKNGVEENAAEPVKTKRPRDCRKLTFC